MNAVLLANGIHGSRGGERVAGPDLAGEAHAEGGEAAVADVIGQHLAGHAHGEHAVGKHGGITGHLRGVHLVGVDGVVIAGGAGVLHQLGAGEIVDDHLFVGVADAERFCGQRHEGFS